MRRLVTVQKVVENPHGPHRVARVHIPSALHDHFPPGAFVAVVWDDERKEMVIWPTEGRES